jgi:hypothetical protein
MNTRNHLEKINKKLEKLEGELNISALKMYFSLISFISCATRRSGFRPASLSISAELDRAREQFPNCFFFVKHPDAVRATELYWKSSQQREWALTEIEGEEYKRDLVIRSAIECKYLSFQ